MGRGEQDLRARLQQLPGIGVENVRVAPHLVDRPETRLGDRLPVGADRHEDQVVDDVDPTDGVALRHALVGVHLAHLDGRDVAVPGQAGRRLAHRPPPVGRRRGHLDLRRREDEIGLADLPARRIGDGGLRVRPGRLATRRTVVGPRRDGRDLLRAQRDIALVVLDTDVLFDIPGRHHVGLADAAGAVLHGPRPWTRLLVGEERHRSHRLGAMALLATPLEDRRDVRGVGHPVLGPLGSERRRSEHHRGADGRRGPKHGPRFPRDRHRHHESLLNRTPKTRRGTTERLHPNRAADGFQRNPARRPRSRPSTARNAGDSGSTGVSGAHRGYSPLTMRVKSMCEPTRPCTPTCRATSRPSRSMFAARARMLSFAVGRSALGRAGE